MIHKQLEVNSPVQIAITCTTLYISCICIWNHLEKLKWIKCNTMGTYLGLIVRTCSLIGVG